KDSLTNYPEPFTVVRCRRCGLVYVNPRPRLEDIGQFYTPEFVSYQFETLIDPKTGTWRDRLMAKITQDIAIQRMNKVRRWIHPNADFRVLDVGCGKGHFLHKLQHEIKCDVSGLDLDESAVNYCRNSLGISVLHG